MTTKDKTIPNSRKHGQYILDGIYAHGYKPGELSAVNIQGEWYVFHNSDFISWRVSWKMDEHGEDWYEYTPTVFGGYDVPPVSD